MIQIPKFGKVSSGLPRINESGSITPLISIYFTVAMLFIFVAANLASMYVARRDLINTTEGALSKAAQELDEYVYYYQIPTPSFISEGDLVPINCSDAGTTFAKEIKLLDTQDPLDAEANPISITSFGCDGRRLTASVERRSPLPFAAKLLGVDSFINRVSVKAISQYR